MRYLVSLSGGVASAVAADRAIARYGRDVVDLWIADTSWEDDDLWRFVADCCKRWGILPYYYRDGRTPLQVAEDRTIIPNQKIAPCSFELKIEPFTRFLRTYPKPVTVMLGLDWKEIHRMEAPRKTMNPSMVSLSIFRSCGNLSTRGPIMRSSNRGVLPRHDYMISGLATIIAVGAVSSKASANGKSCRSTYTSASPKCVIGSKRSEPRVTHAPITLSCAIKQTTAYNP